MSKNIKERILCGIIMFLNVIGIVYLIKNFTVFPIWYTFISLWIILNMIIQLLIKVIEIKTTDNITNIRHF